MVRTSKPQELASTSLPSPRPPSRPVNALPKPSSSHRHRAQAPFIRAARIERLESPPVLYGFGATETTLTNSFNSTKAIVERVSKALGFNTGSGPLWELIEDRACFKEAADHNDSHFEDEARRRPLVYNDVRVKAGWKLLDPQVATTYLPSNAVAIDDGQLLPPPPVACSFYPTPELSRVELKMFESRRICDFIPASKAHIFNAGSPIWGLDWCPIHVTDRHARSYKQYLAVAPFPTHSHSPEIGTRVPRPAKACVQIWTLAPAGDIHHTADKGPDIGLMKCELVLCLDSGAAQEIRWCPLPSHDLIANSSNTAFPRKLGILAGTFEDGSLSVYAVPEPQDMLTKDRDSNAPLFVHLPEPLIRIELVETVCWSLDWGNSELLAVGCANGSIAIYDIAEAIKFPRSPPANPFPIHYLPIHQSAIRAVTWVRIPPSYTTGDVATGKNPTVVASGGYDGMACVWDIREMGGNVINRTRDAINSMAFSCFAGGLIAVDYENVVKSYSLSPSMLGRGHSFMEPAGPAWSVAASDYHPQIAVGSADGACTTTNTCRSTRRGGTVPFLIHKIFQMDYSRKTGEYRMLECFLPQIRPLIAAKRPAAGGAGAWPAEVAVHRVTWNSGNGPGASGMLASGTASGLGRVDWLEGRWAGGRVPYVNVANMRKEGEGELGPEMEDEEMDEDEDEEEEG